MRHLTSANAFSGIESTRISRRQTAQTAPVGLGEPSFQIDSWGCRISGARHTQKLTLGQTILFKSLCRTRPSYLNPFAGQDSPIESPCFEGPTILFKCF